MPKPDGSSPNWRGGGSPRMHGVHVVVEIADGGEPPIAAIAEAGKGFDWLAHEPDLYSYADLMERAG